MPFHFDLIGLSPEASSGEEKEDFDVGSADLQRFSRHDNHLQDLNRTVLENSKYPVSGACVVENASLTSGVRGQNDQTGESR